jgi:transcriptional regulator with XRE-family HTH domain
MTTGNKIKHFRLLKGLSQEKMAELLNITPKAYGNIERNITDVNISRLEQIAKVLEVSLPKLLDFDVQKIVQEVNGDINGDNSQNINMYNSDKDLAHALDKSQQEVSFLKEKIQFLENETNNLKELLLIIKAK